MNLEETKKAVEVMMGFVEGRDIQCRYANAGGHWYEDNNPTWEWGRIEYSLKPTPRTFYAVDYADNPAISDMGPLHTSPPKVVGGRLVELVEVIR